MDILFKAKRYVVQLTEPMLGTVSKNPEVYKTYIESKKGNGKNAIVGATITETQLAEAQHALPLGAVPGGVIVDPMSEDESATVEKIEEKGWTGFHQDEHGLFIYDYMVRGQFKAAANVLKKQLGLKNLRSKIDDFVFVFPRRIYLGKMEPDGVFERPLRAMTPQGPRVTLARSDMVNAGVELNFNVHLLNHAEITFEVIDTLLTYGQYCGFGQFRNGSFGRFVVKSTTAIE